MTKKLKQIACLTLIFVLLFTFVGCKTNIDDVSSALVEYITEEEYIYVDGDNSDNNESVTTSDKPETDIQSKNESGTIEENSMSVPDYYGTTVKFAVTSDPKDSEKGPVIEKFEKEFGIKIEPIIISGDFVTELTGLIASYQSPDVVRSSGDFPLSLSYLQSLDAAKLDYDDPIWEQGMFKLTTFNGSPYLCSTVGNVYTEADIVIYRKDILSAAGCKTPKQYDDEGKWNMDAFFEIASQCVQKVDGVQGCSFVNYDSAIHMSGNAVFKLQDGKFINGINESAVDVFSKLYDNKLNNFITMNATKGIVDGTVAITTHHSYALRKTGAYENYEEIWKDLGYYYLPSCGESNTNLKTGICRGWGLVKGAQNPEGAGVFLRYYLDPNNFDISNMYISSEAATFFLRATDIDYDNWYPYFTYGNKTEEIAGIDFYDDIYSNINLNKQQFTNNFAKINSKIDRACDNLNRYVKQTINSN